MIREYGYPKVNLTLHVTGQRGDGYHLLDSLVVFTKISESLGDQIDISASNANILECKGQFGSEVPTDNDNLIFRAAELYGAGAHRFELTKNIPAAAGLGGGSADAAAVIRALSTMKDRTHPGDAQILRLGADVPVCLKSLTCRMRGIGEVIDDVTNLPPNLGLMLVNSGAKVSTAEIFTNLPNKNNPPMDGIPTGLEIKRFCDWLRRQRNDLEETAIKLCPEIADVLKELSNQPGCLMSRMSGSGATCFGIWNKDDPQFEEARRTLSRKYRSWWVRVAELRTAEV